MLVGALRAATWCSPSMPTNTTSRSSLMDNPLKVLPIKGLVGQSLPFDDYFEFLRQEARSEWRRLQLAAQRRVHLSQAA